MLKWSKSIVFFCLFSCSNYIAGFGESQEFNQAVPEPEPVQPAAPNYSLPREEPEKILKWREEQKLRLEQKGSSEWDSREIDFQVI